MSTETDGEFLARIGTNGEEWAKEFVAKNVGTTHFPYAVDGDQDTQVDILRAWFANAIEAGRSAGQPEPFSIVMSVEKMRTLVFLAAGAATGPLLQDHPGYEFPSERVAEAVENIIANFDFTTPQED